MIAPALLGLALAASPADRLVGAWGAEQGGKVENALTLEGNGLARFLFIAGTWSADEKVIHLGLLGDDGELKTSDAPYQLVGDRLMMEVSLSPGNPPEKLSMSRLPGPPRGPGPTKAPVHLGKGFARVGETIFRAARSFHGGFISLTSTEWVALTLVDVASFRPLALDVGIDKTSVFCPQRLEGFEPQSLRRLGGLLYADSRGGLLNAQNGRIPCRPVFRRQDAGSPHEKFDGATVKALPCNVIGDVTGFYIHVPDPSPFPPTKQTFTGEELEQIEKARLPWVVYQKTTVDPAKLKPGSPYCNELPRPHAEEKKR